MKRWKPIPFPEKYRKELEEMIGGDHTSALAAKRRLTAAAATHKRQGQDKEAALLKRIYRRVKL